MNNSGSQFGHWPRVPLGSICVQDRQIVEAGSADFASRMYLSLEHIEAGTGRILRAPSAPIEDEGKSTTFQFDSHHVLYGKLRPYLNKVALPNFVGRCTTEIIPLKCSNGISRDFLAFFLRRHETVAFAMKHKTGSRMPRADMDSLLTLKIPLPPLAEQERIAARLTEQLAAVASARAAAQARLAAAEALPAAYLREVFEGSEASEWKTQAISDLAKTCSGATPPRSNGGYFKGTIPWVKTGELLDGPITVTEEMVTPAALRDCSLPLLPPGTILIAMYGQGKTRGRTGLLTMEATTNQACFAILPQPERFSSEMLQYWFRANYERLRRITENRGGNQPNLNGVLLRELEVALPAITDQRRLAAALALRLAEAERLTAILRDELAAIDALPAALLLEAFNGQA